MRRPALVSALLAALVAPWLSALAHPRTAEACSLDPVFDPIASVDVAIAGTVVGLRVAEELWDGENAFVPVWVDFAVDRYLNGSGPDRVAALDRVSVIFEDREAAGRHDFDAAQFAGLAGACGALSEDPRGQYWVTALDRPGEHYEVSLGLIVAKGMSASDPAVASALAEAGVTPARTGGSGPSSDTSRLPAYQLALGGLTLVLLGVARALPSRTAGPGRGDR